MSSSCIEEVSVPDDNWYRIANELLSRAGIAINGSAPADIRVKNPDFFKRVLQEGSLGLGESYISSNINKNTGVRYWTFQKSKNLDEKIELYNSVKYKFK